MKSNPKLATLISCVMVLGLAVAQGSSDRRQLGETRSSSLPPYAILDENAQPVIAASGKVGFISSVTAGSLISFSMKTGSVISAVVVGKTAGPVSLVEIGGRRLIAVPAVNDPSEGHPATVSIIDATSPGQMDLKALLVLPPDAHITQTTRALLTRDGRFCLIASSLNEAALFLFDVETGELLSRHMLLERPSELALHDKDGRRRVAVASAVANNLSIISINDSGELSLLSMFSPSDARFDETNNPVFSADGRSVYIAASEGDRLFAIDARSGAQFASLSIPSPQRVAISPPADGDEMIGVTRIRRPANGRPGGVTLISSRGGTLAMKADFTPPDGVEFTTANNLAFDPGAPAAFIGSDTGILFAFNTDTGELESHQELGKGLHRIALNNNARKVAAVRSSPSGDEIVIIGFDLVGLDEPDAAGPAITSIKPDTVEQGRSGLHLIVVAENLTDGDSLVVNGDQEIGAELTKKGKALGAKLRGSLFDVSRELSIQVKTANGVLSQPAFLHVRRPLDPVIDKIAPEQVPGPASSFTLRVTGTGFRASSAIALGAEKLDTELRSDTELRARVPAELVSAVGKLKVQIKDLAIPDLLSNERELTVFGPRITALTPMSSESVVAGDGGFKLKIEGQNFRNQAVVEINGDSLSSSRVRRNGTKVLKVNVPKRFAEDAGKLTFVVRNPEGNASEPMDLDALAPEITSFEPGKVLAGLTNLKVGIRGTNFRNGARVYVANASTGEAVRVERQRVQFRTTTRIVVTLQDEKLNAFIAQKGTLKFQVVNPNNGDGVASADHELAVVGPEISEAVFKPLKRDESRVELQISGANFRAGAVIEFFSEDNVYVRERVPDKTKPDRITLELRAKKVEGLRNLELRVVNPGNVKSESVKPRDDRGTP